MVQGLATDATIAAVRLVVAALLPARSPISGEWLLDRAGLLSIAFGVILIVSPGAGALAVIWVIGRTG
jgi:uncharacterized membrane protein HdeD (DUF308 family)